MTTNKVMNEHEVAFLEALAIMGRAIVSTSRERDQIERGLREAQASLSDTGQLTGAETIGLLLNAIFPSK